MNLIEEWSITDLENWFLRLDPTDIRIVESDNENEAAVNAVIDINQQKQQEGVLAVEQQPMVIQ